ncbi:multiprotein-bridging factor 1 family protein [Streptomyces rimosus]|uniref:helix-turn-helix domain-containing protein n=1 Tax=Streptomyces rimosus TaxID=1927 RepID=UPI00099DAF94|nr:helix-turn-helix transcriptional regulator [Streptomyces rimosus]
MVAQFGEQVRSALRSRGLSIREAARRLNYDPAYLNRVLNGRQVPSPHLVERLDQLLGAEGTVISLAASLTPDDHGRISRSIAHPTRLDRQAVDALAAVLAAQRRLDDAVGAAALIHPTEAQLLTVKQLLRDARGPHRDALLGVVAEYVQFVGWLHASAGNHVEASIHLYDAVDLADEAEDGTLAAQALNFRGYIARRQGRPTAVARWFEAAYHTPGAHAAQRMGDAAQAAQGYAQLRERETAKRLLGEAASLADAAHDQPPGTAYWLTSGFQRLSLGLAHLGMAEHALAADHLRAGLDGLPAEQRHADWTAEYRAALHAADGAR